MRITESKLRSIIRSVIRETSWRDSLPQGPTQTWHGGGKYFDPNAAMQNDIARSTDKAYDKHGHDGRRSPSEGSYSRAERERFYNESGIELDDAYAIARTYLNSPKEEFHIADFVEVSDKGLVFLKHYFNIVSEDSDVIERSDIEDLCFSPEKLDLNPDEF